MITRTVLPATTQAVCEEAGVAGVNAGAPGEYLPEVSTSNGRQLGKRSTKDVAAVVGRHPQAVREWLHRFGINGLDGLGDRPGAGRRPG